MRIWAKKGTRPRLPADQRYTNAYLFGAICPMGAKGAALMLPFANTAAMQMHLDEISCNVAAKAHGVVLMDRAGWHSTDQLKVPKNLTIILLPSRSPELNPVENIWQYLRQNWLSNRVFEDYDAIIEAGCQAWNKLIDQPETIMSIGMRDWAISGRIISAVGITPGHVHQVLPRPVHDPAAAMLAKLCTVARRRELPRGVLAIPWDFGAWT